MARVLAGSQSRPNSSIDERASMDGKGAAKRVEGGNAPPPEMNFDGAVVRFAPRYCRNENGGEGRVYVAPHNRNLQGAGVEDGRLLCW
ncbi:hypothetical protein NPIL_448371 [Nephila pilipes]|uniref:Uncharacterized protein n=1 Tax=Nephila pilipes TaxID=299642 RepID=A0A8X6ILJ9_NEPPI|nr:hypothetical protein NPIL_448371 [Nephila pilipes]